MYSTIALKLYGKIKQGIIKSSAMFWHNFSDKQKIDSFDIDTNLLKKN